MGKWEKFRIGFCGPIFALLMGSLFIGTNCAKFDNDPGLLALLIILNQNTGSGNCYPGGTLIRVCLNPTGSTSLATSEAGGTATFTVVLDSQPLGGSVQLPSIKSDTQLEGKVSPNNLTFTSSNWRTPQTVTVTGQDDSVDDGNIAYNIIIAASTSGDSYFNGYNPPDPVVSNTDDDTWGITVTTGGLITWETPSTTTFTVRLDSRPLVNVLIPLSTSDATEGNTVLPPLPQTLTFTNSGAGGCGGGGNWCNTQTVTVTGVNSADGIDGDQPFTIALDPISAVGDTNYNLVDPADVNFTNLDVDDDKYVYITNNTFDGDLQTAGAAASGIAGADSLCNDVADGNWPGFGVYKAMIMANIRDTGSDWVLLANYDYYQYGVAPPATPLIMTTNGAFIFPFGTLTNSFGAGAATYWTGITIPGWSNNAFSDDCVNWTSNAFGDDGVVGQENQTNSNAIDSGTDNCNQLRALVCVEQ